MAKYELMLIMNPNLSNEDRESSLKSLKTNLEQSGAKIENEDIWWDKKLAYKINLSTRGFYVLYNLELDGKNIINLTKSMNLDLNIWRHMFVKIDV